MKITKEMTIGDVVRNYPQVVPVLMSMGMGCVGCPSAQIETIEQAAQVHGINIDDFLNKLNEAV